MIARKFTPAEDDQLMTMARQGLNTIQIGMRLDRDPGVISSRAKLLREMGYNITFPGQMRQQRKDSCPLTQKDIVPWWMWITGRDQADPAVFRWDRYKGKGAVKK